MLRPGFHQRGRQRRQAKRERVEKWLEAQSKNERQGRKTEMRKTKKIRRKESEPHLNKKII